MRGRRRQVHEERLHVRLVIEYGLHGKVVELEATVARSGCGARRARVLPPVMRRAGRVVDRDDALAVRAGSLCQVVFSSRKEDEALIKAAACRYVPPAAHPEVPLARMHCAVSSRLELGCMAERNVMLRGTPCARSQFPKFCCCTWMGSRPDMKLERDGEQYVVPVESEAFGYELVCVWRVHLWVVPADVVPSGVIGHEEEQVRQSGHVGLEHIRCVDACLAQAQLPAW